LNCSLHTVGTTQTLFAWTVGLLYVGENLFSLIMSSVSGYIQAWVVSAKTVICAGGWNTRTRRRLPISESTLIWV